MAIFMDNIDPVGQEILRLEFEDEDVFFQIVNSVQMGRDFSIHFSRITSSCLQD